MTTKSDVACPAGAEEAHVRFSDWIGGRQIWTLGTNAGTHALPFQSWRPIKEAFAPELVERALHETRKTVRHIADPFGGSGTTALAAQFLGIRPTTIEVNPFLADLIEAKIAPVDFDKATFAFGRVVERVVGGHGPKNPVFAGAPATFVEPGHKGRYIFSRAVARRIIAYRTSIELVEDLACRRLFRVILASTTVPASNVTISGKGRRYRKGWRHREILPETVDRLFRKGVLQALYDLRRYAGRRCLGYRLLRGDARILSTKIGTCDLAVFSPPYPNSFDYTDVYNVELWTLGYLRSSAGNARLRHSTLRSHVQLSQEFDGPGVQSATLRDTVAELDAARDKLWNRHIPEMIGAYVKDLALVLANLSTCLRLFGRAYLVVGDSRYAGINVSVATILTEIAPRLGYEVILSEPCRSMRSSPQQGGRHVLAENLVVLERC